MNIERRAELRAIAPSPSPSLEEAKALSARAHAAARALALDHIAQCLKLSGDLSTLHELAHLPPGVIAHFTRISNELRAGALSASAILERSRT